MSKKRLSILVVLMTLALSIYTGFTAGVARADGGSNVTVTSTQVSIDNPIVDINGVTVSASDIASETVVVGAFVKAHGEPHRLVRKAVANGACFNVGIGTKHRWYQNTYRNAFGQIVKFWDDRFARVCRIHGQLIKVGPVNCGNLIFLRTPPPHVVAVHVIFVRSFARLIVRLYAHVGVSITGLCGSATVTASAGSEASVYISLKVFVRAHGNVSSNIFSKIVVKLQQKATVSIQCNAPPQQHPPTITCTTINDVDAGGFSKNYECTVTCPGTDSCKLTVNSAYGYFDPSDPTPYNGAPDPFVFTYYAPSEQPPGGQDTVTNTAYDLTTGSSAQWIQSFNINPPPPST